MIEHAAALLTKCHVSGDDARTGYHRLRGQPAKDRLPCFGETVYFYVPKKQRGMMDPIWRAGVFLSRSWNSDQNIVGLSSGHVTRARALVRLVPEKRWPRERLQRIVDTPLSQRNHRGLTALKRISCRIPDSHSRGMTTSTSTTTQPYAGSKSHIKIC